ncbi:MAG: porin family protein [Pseudomonadota bacterium]|nr:MAG: porin family protein [Pseudomonadota bacterium]
MLTKRLILSLTLLIATLPVSAGEHILMPMLGVVDWKDNSGHTVRGTPASFDDGANGSLGFRYSYLFDLGLAIGTDIFAYSRDITPSFRADDTSVVHSHFLAQYYFNRQGTVNPFVGGGLGFAAIAFDGGTLDGKASVGVSAQFNAGVLIRLSQRFGLQVEYKYLDFDIDEDIDGLRTDIDTSANTLFLGMTIHI